MWCHFHFPVVEFFLWFLVHVYVWASCIAMNTQSQIETRNVCRNQDFRFSWIDNFFHPPLNRNQQQSPSEPKSTLTAQNRSNFKVKVKKKKVIEEDERCRLWENSFNFFSYYLLFVWWRIIRANIPQRERMNTFIHSATLSFARTFPTNEIDKRFSHPINLFWKGLDFRLCASLSAYNTTSTVICFTSVCTSTAQKSRKMCVSVIKIKLEYNMQKVMNLFLLKIDDFYVLSF